MSKFQFVRIQADGRMGSISPLKTFETIEAAKTSAPDFLNNRRGNNIVLVQVLEAVIATSNVRYEKWDHNTQRKFGLISPQRP